MNQIYDKINRHEYLENEDIVKIITFFSPIFNENIKSKKKNAKKAAKVVLRNHTQIIEYNVSPCVLNKKNP